MTMTGSPRRGRPGGGRRGVTLPEVLVASIVLAVVVGVIAALYSASMRAWYRGATETRAQQKAAWVVQRMGPDIRHGMAVTPASAPYDTVCIAVRIPARSFDSDENTYLNQVGTDADGRPYLIPGGWALYYRGDASGNLSTTGDRVWRRLIDEDGQLVRQMEIADNVVDNPPDASGSPKPMFIYWPDIYRLRSVEITVTVRERLGNRVAQSTMNGELTLRNN